MMKFGRLMVILCLLRVPVVSAGAAQEEWVEVGSEHFVLYTDTGAEKGRLLLGDLEARYAAFSRAFGPLQPRPFPIRVFLMDSREEFTDSVPESALRTIGTRTGNRRGRLVADKSGYVVFSATGTFIVARDQDASDIADDVGHPLGHLLLARSTLWQPFWLQEGVGEYLRRLGRGGGEEAVSREDGFSVSDLLSIVPSATYNDLEDGGRFRKQSYHLLRILMESFPTELETFLQALREDSGSGARPGVPPESLGELLFSYAETPLALNPGTMTSQARELPSAELATNRGDLLLSLGRPRESAVLYNDNPTEAARIGETILAKIRRESPPVRRSLEELALEFSDSGLVHYHLGTLRAESREERSGQISALERAIALLPRMGRAYAGLERSMCRTGGPTWRYRCSERRSNWSRSLLMVSLKYLPRPGCNSVTTKRLARRSESPRNWLIPILRHWSISFCSFRLFTEKWNFIGVRLKRSGSRNSGARSRR